METTASIMAHQRQIDTERSAAGTLDNNIDQNPVTAHLPQSVLLSFTGATTNSNPAQKPDSMGAVGPTQFLVVVNRRIKTFIKSGQPDGIIDASTDTFFSQVLSGDTTSDPQVRYDRLSGRWFVTMMNVFNIPNWVMIAVSSDSRITASTVWYLYRLVPQRPGDPCPTQSEKFDQPWLSVDSNALYISGSLFCGTPRIYSGSSAFVIPKGPLLSGSTATYYFFPNLTGTPNGPGLFNPRGSDNFDANATVGYFIGIDNQTHQKLVLRQITYSAMVPSLGPNIFITPPSPFCAPSVAPENYSGWFLDGNDERLSSATIRNNILWTAHTLKVDAMGSTNSCDVADRDALRWYKIDLSTNPPIVAQSDTIYDKVGTTNPQYFIDGSIMVAGENQLAFGMTGSSAVTYPSAFTVLAGTTANSYTPYDYMAGTAPFLSGQNPQVADWGDYSYTSVDPCDDMSVWTIQEYAFGGSSWGVQVAVLSAAIPTITSISPSPIAAGAQGLSVQISGTGFHDNNPSAGGTDQCAKRLTVTFTSNGVTTPAQATFQNATHIQLNNVNLAAGSYTVTVTNPDGQTASGTLVVQPRTATPIVTTLADSDDGICTATLCSLRDAINYSQPGTTVTFAATVTGTIALNSALGQLSINQNLTIDGTGHNITIDGGNATRLLDIEGSSTNVNLNNLTFIRGTAALGGGIYNGPATTLTISNSTLSNNSASPTSGYGFGGGIYNAGKINLVKSILAHNTTNGYGAGIFNDINSTLNISFSIIDSNNAGQTAGGVYNQSAYYGGSAAIVNIAQSTLTGNTAQYGGGVSNYGVATITNTTIAGNNVATIVGGGVQNYAINGYPATATLLNDTIANNTAPFGNGGGIRTGGDTSVLGTTVLQNTVLSNNAGGECAGYIVDSGYNMQYPDQSCATNSTTATGLASDPAHIVPVNNPLLGPLANNGGFTQTMALQVGSAAIDAGNPAGCTNLSGVLLAADQRGYLRQVGAHCDIGAYEANSTLLIDSIGLFAPSTSSFYLKNSNSTGNQDFLFQFGPTPSTLTPLGGTWTAQAITTIGLYDSSNGNFALRNSNSTGTSDLFFQFGSGGQGLLPLLGDWTGQGYKSVGLYAPASGTFYLKYSNTGGALTTADTTFQYGPSNVGLTPIVGDWTGKGYDSIGLYSQANGYFYLHHCNTVTCASADTTFQYGPATANGGQPATPVIGRWNGGTLTTIGVYVPANAYFYLKNSNSAGNADIQFQYGPGPNAGWQPVIGHWGPPPGSHISTARASIYGSLGFVSNRENQWAIYRLNGDEQHLQRLAMIGSNPVASRPAWSPDGKRVAFVGNQNGAPALYVMNSDGSGVKRIAWSQALNYQPSWAPDGKQIVFASNLGNSTNLYILEVDSGAIQQLTHGISDVSEQPSWSPDGTQIVYATGKGTLDLAVISVDGKTGTLLTRNGRQPTWSPDGKQVAFASTRNGNSQIYVMNADGSNIRRLTTTQAQEEMPTWSPDGQHIAFVSTRDGNAQIYVMNTDGSNVQRLTNNNAQDTLPVWLSR